MKIAHIAPGAGGMYCGMCIRESALAAALRAEGHDITLIPAYTPIRTDDEDVGDGALFFGGINVYLQQKSAVFRHTPWLFDRLLNSRRLVRWATTTSTKPNPVFLGELTASMLSGEHGRQRKELAKLVHALEHTFQPDVIQLTTALLAGMVRQIKATVSAPVLLGLQGEDLFLDELPTAQRERCLSLLRERAAEADGFLAISAYYADAAAERFGIDRARIHVVSSGINLAGIGPAPEPPDVFTVGYLARISPEKGLHVLVDAFGRLREAANGRPCRLKAAGWLGPHERDYLADVRRQAQAGGFADDFEYVGELDRAEKIRFLQSLSAYSVPSVYRDPRGLGTIEAMACGVPVVEPNHGVFPELIEATGGGVLFTPNDPADLAATLGRLMDDEALRRQLGRNAHEAVRDRFSAATMARETLAVYRRYVSADDKPR